MMIKRTLFWLAVALLFAAILYGLNQPGLPRGVPI